jgi:micrococcal nuclease
MPHRFRLSLLLILLISVFAPGAAAPHDGGLDSYGCHHDRKQGGYHCHRGQFAGQSFASQAEMQAARQENYTATPPMPPSIHFTGKVVGVTDGDTISVMHNGRGEKIRLHGIDCPEKGQAFGAVAKQFTSALVFGKEVTVAVQDSDKYGRTIGEITLLDGRVLNQELVKAGLAWWYRKYAPDNAVLEKLEAEAREAKKNLWSDLNPIPPWDYRRAKRR